MAPAINHGNNRIHIKPFSMRSATLANFSVNEKKLFNRTQTPSINRFREDYLVHDQGKSVDLLRQLLQQKINLEIDLLLKKYYDMFFKQAIGNIRENVRDKSSDTTNHKHIFHDILDEAKKMYSEVTTAVPSPSKMHNYNNSNRNDIDTNVSNDHPQCHRTRGRPAKAKHGAMKSTRKNSVNMRKKWKLQNSSKCIKQSNAIVISEKTDFSKENSTWNDSMASSSPVENESFDAYNKL